MFQEMAVSNEQYLITGLTQKFGIIISRFTGPSNSQTFIKYEIHSANKNHEGVKNSENIRTP